MCLYIFFVKLWYTFWVVSQYINGPNCCWVTKGDTVTPLLAKWHYVVEVWSALILWMPFEVSLSSLMESIMSPVNADTYGTFIWLWSTVELWRWPHLHTSAGLYRVIQEERSVFWEVLVSVIVRRKSLYEHVSSSEWLLR